MNIVKRILKALGCTLGCYILSLWLFSLVGLHFKNMSVSQGDTWIIICIGLVIIFSIYICTFTVLDKIKTTTAKE